jgi:hypothetical protein
MTEVMFESLDDIQSALSAASGGDVLTGARALEEKYGVQLDVLVVADPS